jgi:hypothetical protein
MSTNDHNQEKGIEEPLIEVPDDFDLASARAAKSRTPEEKRKRCPYDDCGSVSLSPRRPEKMSSADGRNCSPGEYYCVECQRFFDEPEVPER